MDPKISDRWVTSIYHEIEQEQKEKFEAQLKGTQLRIDDLGESNKVLQRENGELEEQLVSARRELKSAIARQHRLEGEIGALKRLLDDGHRHQPANDRSVTEPRS